MPTASSMTPVLGPALAALADPDGAPRACVLAQGVLARAPERLHIEQSPLSRAIKELEEDLGAWLFVRTTRSTRLTRAGKLLLGKRRGGPAKLNTAISG